MTMRTVEQIDAICTYEDFLAFLEDFHKDLRDNPETWENTNLLDFLEALSAFAHDMDGFYLNRGLPVPKSPQWNTFAYMLVAATMYE
jgi:hypothetical protein